MRWRAGVLGGGFAVEEPSRWEATETDLRCVVRGVLAETRGNDRSARIIEGDISGKLAQRFHHSDAALRVPHFHPDMKTLNWHQHGSTCTSSANSATCQRPAASDPLRFRQIGRGRLEFADR